MARNTWVGANRSVAVAFWFVKFGFEKKNQKGRKEERKRQKTLGFQSYWVAFKAISFTSTTSPAT